MTGGVDNQDAKSQTVAQLSELAGGLAHELRNPLSTMMVNLKLLAEDLSDPGVNVDDMRRRALLKVDVLRHQAERLQALFDDFLNLTGPRELDRSPVDLHQVLDRLFEFFEPMATSQGVEMIKRFATATLICPVDEKLLNQALLNLVVNAKDAMPQGGTLTCATSSDPDGVTITVSDTGVGIAPEEQERIFKPFFSGKATGTGLGLPLTLRIIEEHGGTLSVSSEVGRGTTFVVRLPMRATRDADAG